MPDRPKVLIIGDSISMGYFPHVRELLADRYEAVRSPGNAGDSDNVLSNVEEWLERDGDAALVHLNCGLHDIKVQRDAEGNQVSLDRYRENLLRIIGRIIAAGKELIWASSTPVIFERHRRRKEFDRSEEDVEAYNAAALEIAEAAGLATDDLHAAVVTAGTEKCLSEDGVHLTDEGYRLLARSVAKAICDCMEGSG